MLDTVRGPASSLKRVDQDLTVRKVYDRVDFPNTTAFSAVDSRMCFSDSPAKKIWMHHLYKWCIFNRRLFVDCSANRRVSDGTAIDQDGRLWNANYGGGRIASCIPAGKIEHAIPLALTKPSCRSLGWTRYTSPPHPKLTPEQLAFKPLAGGIFLLHTGSRGVPATSFAR